MTDESKREFIADIEALLKDVPAKSAWTEIQADPRRCPWCKYLMSAIWQSAAKAFTVYKCDAQTCGRELVVDSFNLEVK